MLASSATLYIESSAIGRLQSTLKEETEKKKRQKRSEPDGKAEKATARSSGFKGMPGSDVIGCGGDYVLCRVPSSSVLHLILVFFFYPSVIIIFFALLCPLAPRPYGSAASQKRLCLWHGE